MISLAAAAPVRDGFISRTRETIFAPALAFWR